MELDRLIHVLNSLIATCQDGKQGYLVAAQAIEDMDMKKLLGQFAVERKRFEEMLRAEVERLGGKPHEHGTTVGAVHRGWIQLRERVGHPTEAQILKECDRGESFSLINYDDALSMFELPANVKNMLAEQRVRVAEVRETIREWAGAATG